MSDIQPSLIESAAAGDAGAVEAELQRGVEVDQVEDGRTALHYAAAEGLLDVVKVLLYFKANPAKRSRMEEDNGGTALHLAAENGHLEVLEELLQAKANVDIMDSKGRQASHRAASNGQRRALEILYKHGADMDSRDGGKATPLHFACFHGDLDTVRWLVEEAGVVTTSKDKNGRQPKDVAKKFNNNAVHKYLKNSGGGGGKRGGGAGSMFGGARGRRSMREASSRDRLAQSREISSSRRLHDSPVLSSEPESLPVAPRHHDLADGDTREAKAPPQPASLPVGLDQAPPDTRGSMPSLSPPDSPRESRSLDRRGRDRESRRRTWSLGGTAKSRPAARELRGQLEELMNIKTQQEEELEFKREELSKLKSVLSQVQQEKTQAEEQVSELRYHVEAQRQQLTEAVEAQERIRAHQQEQEAAMREGARREDEMQELLATAKKDVDALRERDALSQQTIEALTKKVERLSMETRLSEERLQQKEGTLKEALRQVEEGTAAAAQLASLKEEIEHLTCMMDDTRENAMIIQSQLEKKNAQLREENEKKSDTIAMLSERLREAEMTSTNSKEAEQRMQEMREKETESHLTIAALNAKIQQLQQNISDHDNKTLTYHKQQQSKIEELTEANEAKQTTIASLSSETEQLNRRVREQQDSIVWYQGQVQQKARENEEKEADRQKEVSMLKEEVQQLNMKLEEAQKNSLTQYERGGTVVALQKRDTAQKQTIKALENRLDHLTRKMADAEQASLSIQRQQLETINKLKEELDEARRTTGANQDKAGGQQQAIQELKEKDLSNQLIIEALNRKIDQLSEELKKNYTNFFSWQTQQQEKDKEHEQREAASQKTIADLQEEVERLSRGGQQQQKVPIRQAPQPWRPSGPPPPVPYSQKYNHVSPPRSDTYTSPYNHQQHH